MSTLIHVPAGLQSPEIEIMLSRTQQAINDGEDVVVVGCAGGPRYACSFNIYGVAPICYVCNRQKEKGLERLKGKYTYLTSPVNHHNVCTAGVSSGEVLDRWAVKSLNYRSVDIGQAAYSSYVGQARDLDLEGALALSRLRKLIHTSELQSSYFFDLLKEKRITRVVLYNGRQNQNRPLLRVARLLDIEVEVMEFSGQDAQCVYEFRNCLPQNLDNLSSLIEANWKRFEGDREAAAYRYFEYKRQGGAINDSSYVLSQTRGLLPPGWDPGKRNIVIFNSSEDEFAALGGEYDESLYPSQTEAIVRICKSLANDRDIQIYLRIHPNLRAVKWSFAKRLRHLSRWYANVIVIPPESPVSTYALLDGGDVAVSFGSTVGIEAAYWNKPSILLGRCIYERTGSVYVPRSHDELIALLKRRSLEPLPTLGAKKIALFWIAGGKGIKYFGGSRKTGFTFANMRIEKSPLERAIYIAFKTIEKWVFSAFLNYYVSRWRKFLGRTFACAGSGNGSDSPLEKKDGAAVGSGLLSGRDGRQVASRSGSKREISRG